MKHSIPILGLVGLSLAALSSAPASAATRQQRLPAKYTALDAAKTKPAIPAQPTTARQDFNADGTDIAIRLQDGHHGDGSL
ncbi:hypothetical protein [Methylobacterium sp. Leaf88]|uniref:hypothetical protein n=1 Tax=Methylobacterium sp. Leaf88 TaxID=1736244 RepID=UPI000A57C507|nr:hypothetical protein [Methylobacterium sp. Leaf88]